MFKPLLPIINDAVSHIFKDAVHVATVHALYGENHVDYEIKAAASENDNDKNQNTLRSCEDISVHTPVKEYVTHCAGLSSYGNKSFARNNDNTCVIYLPRQLEPPKFFDK